jgi:hypothetical protein
MEQDPSEEIDVRIAVKKNTQTLMRPRGSFLFAQWGPTLDLLSQIDPISISKV